MAAGVGGTAAVVGGGAYQPHWRRRQHEAEERLDSLRNASNELTVDQLAHGRSRCSTTGQGKPTDTDNAVRTSTDELALAVDEFGGRRPPRSQGRRGGAGSPTRSCCASAPDGAITECR